MDVVCTVILSIVNSALFGWERVFVLSFGVLVLVVVGVGLTVGGCVVLTVRCCE